MKPVKMACLPSPGSCRCRKSTPCLGCDFPCVLNRIRDRCPPGLPPEGGVLVRVVFCSQCGLLAGSQLYVSFGLCFLTASSVPLTVCCLWAWTSALCVRRWPWMCGSPVSLYRVTWGCGQCTGPAHLGKDHVFLTSHVPVFAFT